MTTTYSAVVTGYFQPNTDQVAIEIDAASTTAVRIKKIRITTTDGQDLSVEDGYKAVDLIIESTGTPDGTLYTPKELDDNAPASTSIVTVGPSTKGTVSQIIDTISVHAGTDFLWVAADEDDKIVLQPGQMFAIVVNAAA